MGIGPDTLDLAREEAATLDQVGPRVLAQHQQSVVVADDLEVGFIRFTIGWILEILARQGFGVRS